MSHSNPHGYKDPIWRLLAVVIAFYLFVLTLFFAGAI